MVQFATIAIELNNMAVSLLLDGQHENAVQHFQSAFAYLQHTALPDAFGFCPSAGKALLSIPVQSLLTEKTAYFLYNRVLVLSSEAVSPRLIAAVILFNWGLVHHSYGVRLEVGAALPQALDLYEQALLCAQEGGIDSQHLVLALLNNMGHIYALQARFEETKRLFSQMKKNLDVATQHYRTDGIEDEEYAIFLFNEYQIDFLRAAPAA